MTDRYCLCGYHERCGSSLLLVSSDVKPWNVPSTTGCTSARIDPCLVFFVSPSVVDRNTAVAYGVSLGRRSNKSTTSSELIYVPLFLVKSARRSTDNTMKTHLGCFALQEVQVANASMRCFLRCDVRRAVSSLAASLISIVLQYVAIFNADWRSNEK